MRELTERQKEVLSFIAEYINNHSYPPTIREIAENFEISVKGAHDHVTALRRKKYLKQRMSPFLDFIVKIMAKCKF